MKKSVLVLLACALFVSGCAFGTRKPTLNYEVALPAAPQNNITIKVSEFTDERTWSKEKIGDVKNGYGMRCAEIIPQNSVVGWVTDALKKELANAGYNISDNQTASNVAQGAVLEAYVDAYWNYGGRVRLKVALKKDGKDVLNKEYSVQKNCGINMAARAASYAKTLEMTLQDVMRQVIPDIDAALKQ